MNAPQIYCLGCDKVFNPRGLSQHLTKSQNAVCRAVALKTPSAFQTTSGKGLISNPRSRDNRDLDAADVLDGAYCV